jgi:hypothetical protein
LLRKDPNLGGKKTVRSLHWVDSNAPPPPETDEPYFKWLTDFFGYLGQAAKLTIWVIGAILAALAVVWLTRIIRRTAPNSAIKTAAPPSHVQNLDVRPDSLPNDVGAAALALLQAGKPREALALLYRGALSRAIHRFQVQIEESYTEGEVLGAVRRQLSPQGIAYFAQLLGLWQREVYAGEHPPSEPIAHLCGEFSPTLGGVV